MTATIKNFSEVNFGSIKVQKNEPKKSLAYQKQEVAIEFADNPSQKLLIKKTTIIPKKSFRIEKSGKKYYPTVDYDGKLNHKYIVQGSCWDKGYSQFSHEFKPKTLNVLNKHIKSTKISNENYPFGTIGISSTLNDCLTTDGLYQCAGVAFIDKKHNLQTLVHICPMVANEANEKLLNYVLSYSKPEDLEIYITPGEMEETDKTIEFIVDTIKNKDKNYNINFVNFPDRKNTTLVLKNGELMCTTKENNHTIEINPENRIIYA